jgi:tRNA pseudouridine38-40 synthase
VVPHRFHARHDAVGRRYLYQLARRRTAFAKPFVWWVKDDVDLDRMRDAARGLTGMRDFRAFAEADADAEPSEKRLVLVERIDIEHAGDLVLVAIEGSHFIWKMVRRIVGVLVEIGRGGLEPSAIGELFEGPSETPARLTAPASGLFLERVYYHGDERQKEVRPATPLNRT